MRQESGKESRTKKRLKPTWQKTDIPKPVRIELYRIMRDYPTQVNSEKALARSTELDKFEHEFGEIPVSRDTFKRLKSEIRQMPASEVSTLPQDLQDWIVEIRQELKSELQKLKEQQSDGGVNWIEDHLSKYGEYPVLPKPLDRLVLNYVPGEPVRKTMVTRPSNIGTWNEIKSVAGLEKKWREFLEWKGQDPDEYEYEARRLAPPGGPGPMKLTHKPPGRP